MLRINRKYLASLIKEEISKILSEKKPPTISDKRPSPAEGQLTKAAAGAVASWLQGNAGSLAAAAQAAQGYESKSQEDPTYGTSLKPSRTGPDMGDKSLATGKNSATWLGKWMKDWRPAPVKTPFGLITVKNKNVNAIIDTSFDGDVGSSNSPLFGFNIDASLELTAENPRGKTRIPIDIKNITIELGVDGENLPMISGKFSKTENFEEKSTTHDIGLNFALKGFNLSGGITTTKTKDQPDKKTRRASIGGKIGKSNVTLSASGNSLKDWSTSVSVGTPDSSISFTGGLSPGEVSAQAGQDLPEPLRGRAKTKKFSNLGLGAQYTHRFE